jgi:molecular chaperone DnaJ
MKEYKNINLYAVLEVNNNSDINEIKNSYRRLSKKYHPDVSKENDANLIFSEISKAYEILSNEELKSEYDLKSKWGNNYNEYYDFFDVDFDLSYQNEKEKLENFKKNEVWNIQIEIDGTFNGTIEYERWVKCKSCDGTGKDSSSKILIRDNNGKVVKTFDGEDGCDYCEGTGKDYRGYNCAFCSGNGKIGLNQCKKCNGERRILGNQKINGIKLTGDETKLEAMGHFSKNEPGKVGYLLLIKKV